MYVCSKIFDGVIANSVIQNMHYEKLNLLSKLISKSYIQLHSTIKTKLRNTDCLLWYIGVYIQVNVYIVNYIYKQIHKKNWGGKMFAQFIETYFLTNGNPYGRSLSLRRHTYC